MVNPVAGGKDNRQDQLTGLINKNVDGGCIEHSIMIWERPEQRNEISDAVQHGGYDIVVAVGGDGTINMVAQAAMNANVSLGIVPIGSGNGLARHLHIPLETAEAINLINTGEEMAIDCGSVEGIPFFCTSGIGFDALIGDLFANSTSRGFSTYFRITLGQLLRYRPLEYTIHMSGKSIARKAFLITIANASQYGNDAFIAPQASITDGYLDICILKPFKFWHIPGLAIRMFRRTITSSPLYETYKAKGLEVVRKESGPVHYDGEPLMLGLKLRYEANPASLRVIVPSVFIELTEQRKLEFVGEEA